MFYRTNFTDVLVIFRAFRKDILKKIKIDVKEDIDMQLCIKCAKKKFKVVDIPGDEPKRIGGKRKIGVIKTGFELLVTFFKEVFR